MPKKEELYLSKMQIQRLCELQYNLVKPPSSVQPDKEEEHFWNIQSPHYLKKNPLYPFLESF
jgi:hypothetical protein